VCSLPVEGYSDFCPKEKTKGGFLMWVTLNGKGLDKYHDIFPDGKVPICSIDFFTATLGENTIAEVVLVSWKHLTPEQKRALLAKINETLGGNQEDLARQIATRGLPLRKEYTNGVVAMELRYFI
jgi:hypothetical protein